MGLQFSAFGIINTRLRRSVMLLARPFDIAKPHLNTIQHRDFVTYSVLHFEENRVRQPVQNVTQLAC